MRLRIVLPVLALFLVVVGALLICIDETGPTPGQPERAAVGAAEAGGVVLERPEPVGGERAGPVEGSVERLKPAWRASNVDKAERAALLAQLVKKLGEQRRSDASESGAGQGQAAGDSQGSLSPEYIKKQIMEIRPLLKECYSLALDRHPDLGGVLKVQFTIIADEEYGGLVETSEVLQETELAANEVLSECLRETMYAMRFDPPKGGGRITVTYPMMFTTAGTDGKSSHRAPKKALKPELQREH